MENVFEQRKSIFEPERESDAVFEMKSEKMFISFSKGDLIKGIGNQPMKIESVEHRMSICAQGVTIITSI